MAEQVRVLIVLAHLLEPDSGFVSLGSAAMPSRQPFDLYSEKFVPYFASVTYFVRGSTPHEQIGMLLGSLGDVVQLLNLCK
jgi:hypothetical protein